MSSQADVTERLLILTRARFGIEEKNLSAEADLFATLGIDSVQALDLLSLVEREFRIELPDYELADVRRFADLALKIHERL